jgi:hypothetical protein
MPCAFQSFHQHLNSVHTMQAFRYFLNAIDSIVASGWWEELIVAEGRAGGALGDPAQIGKAVRLAAREACDEAAIFPPTFLRRREGKAAAEHATSFEDFLRRARGALDERLRAVVKRPPCDPPPHAHTPSRRISHHASAGEVLPPPPSAPRGAPPAPRRPRADAGGRAGGRSSTGCLCSSSTTPPSSTLSSMARSACAQRPAPRGRAQPRCGARAAGRVRLSARGRAQVRVLWPGLASAFDRIVCDRRAPAPAPVLAATRAEIETFFDRLLLETHTALADPKGKFNVRLGGLFKRCSDGSFFNYLHTPFSLGVHLTFSFAVGALRGVRAPARRVALGSRAPPPLCLVVSACCVPPS